MVINLLRKSRKYCLKNSRQSGFISTELSFLFCTEFVIYFPFTWIKTMLYFSRFWMCTNLEKLLLADICLYSNILNWLWQ